VDDHTAERSHFFGVNNFTLGAKKTPTRAEQPFDTIVASQSPGEAPQPLTLNSLGVEPRLPCGWGSSFSGFAWYRVHGLPIMDEAKQPEPIKSEPKESTASRIERREAEIALAMKQEAERRAAVIKNMQRLRALRLSQTSKGSASISR
jgi:hypothetical protein